MLKYSSFCKFRNFFIKMQKIMLEFCDTKLFLEHLENLFPLRKCQFSNVKSIFGCISKHNLNSAFCGSNGRPIYQTDFTGHTNWRPPYLSQITSMYFQQTLSDLYMEASNSWIKRFHCNLKLKLNELIYISESQIYIDKKDLALFECLCVCELICFKFCLLID